MTIHSAIPRWVKATHTGFVAVLIPTYWRHYGPGNFLWFSDVALLTSARGAFVFALMIAIPLALQRPAHLLLKRLFPAPAR